MRAWASRQPGTFSPAELCIGIGVIPPDDRLRVRSAIRDFTARGEMERAGEGIYRYNHQWQRQGLPFPLKAKLIKAAYVAGPSFTVADLMRWAEATDRRYVQRTLQKLVRTGHVERTGTRKIPQGRESLYQVPDRNRFRKDLI
jgi:hypothetical protein